VPTVFVDAHVKGKVITHVNVSAAIPDTRPPLVISDARAPASGPQVIIFNPRLLGNQ
jgi:hypothetical protein